MAEFNPIRYAHQHELLATLAPVVEEHLGMLLPVDKAWQPTDFLPDLTGEDWREQLARFREPAQQLRDDVLVVLVGDMVTEEALPNYAISLNLIAKDEHGDSPAPWARWMRGWTSEENRHGDLLNAFLRLTGRADMRAVEVTVHNLIASGFNSRSFPDAYGGLIYTSFQERATMISHANVGKLALKDGDENVARICAKIAGDEARHASFYTRITNEVMDRDPEMAVLVFRDMMRRVIAMPGKLMYDGKDPDLFEHFAATAQRLGVYTVHDYAGIVRHLVDAWKIGHRSLSGKAAKAQDWLCGQAERLESLAEMVADDIAKRPLVPFSWIHGRTA
jgi:acyl-[acyl-carrier-protein] desaturase